MADGLFCEAAAVDGVERVWLGVDETGGVRACGVGDTLEVWVVRFVRRGNPDVDTRFLVVLGDVFGPQDGFL